MSHRKAVVAILMALLMVFISVPVSVAGGPAGNTPGGVQTDGGDGHPWDDGTGGQDTTPPDDNQPEETEAPPVIVPGEILAASYGPSSEWLSSAMIYVWKTIKSEVKRMRPASSNYRTARAK